MADLHIDQQETLGYGEFAIKQIKSLAPEIDEDLRGSLHGMAARLTKATKAMESALRKAGDLPKTTFTGIASQEGDPVTNGRNLLHRVVRYAESREGGAAIAVELLGGETLTTLKRRRPAKLVHALGVALRAVGKHKDALPEHAKWTADLTAAQTALSKLDGEVRASRQQRKAMTPAVAKARLSWLNIYGAAKLIVEGALKVLGQTERMPDIFDDLAEIHRVAGVIDDAATPAPPDVQTSPKAASPA
jgi:hypothetical protein